MTVVRRTIRSVPQRTAAQTWEVIVDVIAPTKGSARDELLSIAGIASSILAEEITSESPIVVHGCGPRIRIYCLFHEDAIDGEGAEESALVSIPTEGDWRMSLPALADDLDWIRKALKAKSSRITARDNTKDVIEADETDARTTKSGDVDMEAFFRL